jgi:ribosomal protein S8
LKIQNRRHPRIPKLTKASKAGISTYQNLYPLPKIKSNQSLEIIRLIKAIF